MAGFEQGVESLLQGVSQQLPKLRLPGQVTAQDNMLSDVVTNVRRRPGAEVLYNFAFPGETNASIRAWETDVAGQQVHVILGTNTGTIKILSQGYAVLATLQQNYLVASTPQAIRACTIANEFYLMNVEKQANIGAPVEESAISPLRAGWAYVKAGQFSKQYTVTVTTLQGVATLTYTAPSGATVGDALAATPEQIMSQMATAGAASMSAAGVLHSVHGPYIFFVTAADNGKCTVATTSGSNYVGVSGQSNVRVESDLPQSLPASANGIVMAIGEQRAFRYYKYNHSRAAWLESGAWGSPGSLQGMPISLTYEAGVWKFITKVYEGRLAGDDDTNPTPEFMIRKFSGMGAFQSRLVFLCGSKVFLSSSANTRRFYRSTVTSLLDADTIGIGSSANSSAEYLYAIPFQKDLLLFSSKYQALIPTQGQAITPRTATVLLTSTYSMDAGCEPVPVGRTVLFPAPRSNDFFGFMEMVSSQYTDSQYVANDATAHLPKYMGGTCRFGVSSSVASMVLFGGTRDLSSLIVYEYAWDGDTKVQQAWHTWRFKYNLATAYFSSGAVNILFLSGGHLVGCRVDPRQGVVAADATRRPYLDLYSTVQVSGGVGTVPAWMRTFDPALALNLRVSVSTGPLAGEAVGIASYNPFTGVFTTVRSFKEGAVCVGVPYRSLLSPTPPLYRDRAGLKVESSKLTVLRFGVSTQNSGEYQVMVTDSTTTDVAELTQATLHYSSADLVLGQARVSTTARAVVPCRTDANTTNLVMYTEGAGELNFTGIDYTARFNQRTNRR